MWKYQHPANSFSLYVNGCVDFSERLILLPIHTRNAIAAKPTTDIPTGLSGAVFLNSLMKSMNMKRVMTPAASDNLCMPVHRPCFDIRITANANAYVQIISTSMATAGGMFPREGLR